MAPPWPWRWRPVSVWVALAAAPAAASQEAELFPHGPALLSSDYMHAHYEFSLMRKNMARQGTGELWLSFAHGYPRLRLRGAARSPRFGDGEITIVVDSAAKTMYALFKLGALHEQQCLKYPFPRLEERANADRLKLLQWRKLQVMDWQAAEASTWGAGAKLLEVNWTKSNVLEFSVAPDGTHVSGVRLKRKPGGRVVKTIAIQGIPERAAAGGTDAAFAPPAAGCVPADLEKSPLAKVELRPPHQASSALFDLLLILADRTVKWPALFVMLSAVTVPGDVSVMIEDPEPPHPETYGGVSFDYTATVFSRGKKHTSDGSIWLSLATRALRLQGEAKETLVGPLTMDVIARGAPVPKIYANVDVPDQKEQECVVYDYPHLDRNSTGELLELSKQGLSFYAIADLAGEDCGIFVAPLARGRWIHVWVDMEADNPHAILRSEIHKNGQVLRSTDVLRWRTGEDIGVAVVPDPEWGCRAGPHESQLAHLGLEEVHRRSIQLQDALYAIHRLPTGFAVLEVLGLTGDVAIMVQEPEPPELWRLPAVSFNYTLHLGPRSSDVPAQQFFTGAFAADLVKGSVRMTAAADAENAPRISLSLEPGFLAVRVERRGPGSAWDRQCLSLALDDETAGGASGAQAIGQVGIFDRVEAIGDDECNKFSFLGTGAHSESVDFWFSKEMNAVCQLEVVPPEGDGESRVGAHIEVPTWEPLFMPSVGVGGGLAVAGASDGWDCVPASQVEHSWLSLASNAPPSALRGAVALAKLAEAGGVVGLLPPRAADTLSRLVITPPSGGPTVSTTTAAAQTSIFAPGLATFSFRFTSTVGQGLLESPLPESAASAHVGPVGRGEVMVDLEHQRLHLRSEAINLSAGIPQVESRVLFRGDRRRLYVNTRMRSEQFEQCWSVTYNEDSLSFNRQQRNPFTRAVLDSSSFVSGAPDEAKKYSFLLDEGKRVELFVTGASSLVAINLNDLSQNNSSGIVVNDWSTAPLGVEYFTPDEGWDCHDLKLPKEEIEILQWDLIRLFFTTNTFEESQERRLHSV